MARISLCQVDLDFPIVSSASVSLQLRLYQALGGELANHDQMIVIRALKGIDLELADGDRIGLIGPNGAGKTSLLRMLAGVYQPTGGCVAIDGKISSLTDITLGMDSEATGLDNIVFRLIFMGLTFRAARALAPAIAEFSELGEYLKLPVRTYSAGMYLRLAFAISTSIDPEIMIMDEMISVGDASFIEKAKRRIHALLERTSILALASHDLAMVRQICNKAAWLEHGIIKALGPPDEVISLYCAAAGVPDHSGGVAPAGGEAKGDGARKKEAWVEG
jgi:ABC-type polysaccharide/polyol phosphate transport system ATPase subunit